MDEWTMKVPESVLVQGMQLYLDSKYLPGKAPKVTSVTRDNAGYNSGIFEVKFVEPKVEA